MTDVRTALVIGGGIAGPVTAMALQRIGVEATVCEAYDSTADGVGAALTIAPNGLNALRVLDADEAVRAVGIPTPRIVLQSGTGKVLGEVNDPPGLPTSLTVSRADLYRALHEEATGRAVRVEHGRRLVSAEETGDGVTAHFADGSTARADILIGADGIRSTVRSLVDPDAPEPRYGGLLNFGGWTANPGLAAPGGAWHMVFGRRAFFGYLVQDDGRVMWFSNLPSRDPVTRAQMQATPPREWLRRLRETYADDDTPATRILERVSEDELLIVGPVEDLPTVPRWHRGRIVLVGDAAHATSPSSGQGASLAVESAVELARCLRDLPVAEAFDAYESLRRARVERVIANAARTNSNKAAGPVARVLRDLLLPVVIKHMLKPEKQAWLYAHQIDWDAPVTADVASAVRFVTPTRES